MVRTVRVEKRVNEIVNRLNKTKVERKPDLKAEREAVNEAERAERKLHMRDKKRREEMERLEKERQSEIRSYKGLMVAEKMTSNKQVASTNKSLQELEEDFIGGVSGELEGRGEGGVERLKERGEWRGRGRRREEMNDIFATYPPQFRIFAPLT
ncbi:hypothetical protein IFM89_016179 [Coptis chinensis]|uniref:Uncharacterized protein n=1 Tax=Coptis chinensis TaxID=261450 RepID=A0A835LEG1_9MAGN|nr:hypothetical protein IFM89_016179 [Coptis chinensis]